MTAAQHQQGENEKEKLFLSFLSDFPARFLISHAHHITSLHIHFTY